MMLGRVLMMMIVFYSAIAVAAFADPIVVKNDRGGSVTKRTYEVHRLQREGAEVRIQGNCFSACAMLLYVDNVCVTRRAKLGFHAPYRIGSKLSADEKQKWVDHIAKYYPPVLADLYKSEYSHSRKLVKIKGAWLIENAGVKECV